MLNWSHSHALPVKREERKIACVCGYPSDQVAQLLEGVGLGLLFGFCGDEFTRPAAEFAPLP